MKRLNDDTWDRINEAVKLKGKKILEVGCGNGEKTLALAAYTGEVYAVDPREESIKTAKAEHARPNIHYAVGSAQRLDFDAACFDAVLFTLSFHHVPVESMRTAIEEAVRVVKPGGNIVFAEPGFNADFYEAEKYFATSEGDERAVKARAYSEMLNSSKLKESHEINFDYQVVFSSAEEFRKLMAPTIHLDELEAHLKQRAYTLNARRRINIFQPA